MIKCKIDQAPNGPGKVREGVEIVDLVAVPPVGAMIIIQTEGLPDRQYAVLAVQFVLAKDGSQVVGLLCQKANVSGIIPVGAGALAGLPGLREQ